MRHSPPHRSAGTPAPGGADGFEFLARPSVGRAAWDAVADDSADAWLWHRFDLCEALGQWDGSADASFGIRGEGRLLGIVPRRVISYRRLRALAACDVETHGGVAVAPGVGRRLAARVRRLAVEHAQLRAGARVMELRFALAPLAPALRAPDAPRVNPLLELGFENTLTQTWMVDLRVGEKALWEGMEGRARTAIRKAQRSGVSVRPARPDAADLATYVDLHLATCARTGAQAHPRPYFEAIWRDFLPQRLARVLLAERDGRVIAARNFAVYKHGALTWTAAGLEEAGPLGANALLQWEAMRGLAREGIAWSESGEAFPGATASKQRGLDQFKRSFGGALVPFYRGRIDLRRPALRRLDAMRHPQLG